MNYKDQICLNNAYILVSEQQQIKAELDSILLDEGISELLKAGGEFVGGIARGVRQTATDLNQGIQQTVSDISLLPQELRNWSQVEIPEYINKMADFILNIGYGALAGGAGTYALGQLFMYLAKKMGKEAEQNYDALVSMLPNTVQEKIKEIEYLKEKDRAQYDLAVFELHKKSLAELKKYLNSKGIKTENGALAKSLNFLGKALTSNAGIISGAIAIPTLLYKLGLNPIPIFPVINF